MRIKEWTILRRLWRGIRPFKWPRRDRTAFEEDRRTIFRWRCSGSGPSTGHRRKGSQSSLRIGYYDGLFGSTFRQGSLPRSRTTNASRSTDHILWSAWSGSVTSVQRFHSPGALQNCAIWKASCESCSLLHRWIGHKLVHITLRLSVHRWIDVSSSFKLWQADGWQRQETQRMLRPRALRDDRDRLPGTARRKDASTTAPSSHNWPSTGQFGLRWHVFSRPDRQARVIPKVQQKQPFEWHKFSI